MAVPGKRPVNALCSVNFGENCLETNGLVFFVVNYPESSRKTAIWISLLILLNRTFSLNRFVRSAKRGTRSRVPRCCSPINRWKNSGVG